VKRVRLALGEHKIADDVLRLGPYSVLIAET
jgi:hypothetical protein